MSDFEKLNPFAYKSLLNWFLTYKKYDGKPFKNFYLNEGKVLSQLEAEDVVQKTHKMWKNRKHNFGN